MCSLSFDFSPNLSALLCFIAHRISKPSQGDWGLQRAFDLGNDPQRCGLELEKDPGEEQVQAELQRDRGRRGKVAEGQAQRGQVQAVVRLFRQGVERHGLNSYVMKRNRVIMNFFQVCTKLISVLLENWCRFIYGDDFFGKM